MSASRSRSASPSREEPRPKKQKTGGFKWKEKRPQDEEASKANNAGLERGYRNRSPARERYRDTAAEKEKYPPRDRERNRDRPTGRDRDDDRYGDRGARGETDSYRPRDRERDRDRNYSGDRANRVNRSESKPSPSADSSLPKEEKKKKNSDPPKDKKKKSSKPPASTEPMIIVNINDRLGTKAAIPCLASDSIKAFKAVVAAHIGRQPHEIMLKRQGERPFKDQLTLEDYGVSNGVQLDLELDTGD